MSPRSAHTEVKAILNLLRNIIKLHYYFELVKRFNIKEIVLDLNKRTQGAMSPIIEVQNFVLRE